MSSGSIKEEYCVAAPDQGSRVSVREDFIRFIDESKINAVLIEAISELNALPEKPDNPTEWIGKFFRREAPNRYNEMETEKASLQEQIIAVKSKLHELSLEEKQKFDRIEILRRKIQAFGSFTAEPKVEHKVHDYYKDSHEHPFWRIQPDPFFRTSCSAKKLFGFEDNTGDSKNVEKEVEVNDFPGSSVVSNVGSKESDSDEEEAINKLMKVKQEKRRLEEVNDE